MRLDKALLELGLARSRTHAQKLIKDGSVRVNGKVATTVSALVPLNPAAFQMIDTVENRYVSRGGLKIEAALDFIRAQFQLAQLTDLSAHPLLALDVGISTGGFTDALLQAGVAHVWGVDVGHGQLAPSLAQDTRIRHFEGLNARHLTPELAARVAPDPLPSFDLVTVDASFISLRLILPEAWRHLRAGGLLIALVKPQFELGASALDKRGVVKDPNLYQNLELAMREWAADVRGDFVHWMNSPITGGDGNHEFLMIVKKPAA